MRRRPAYAPTRQDLQQDYRHEAAYFYFRAATPDENMVSVLHRLAADAFRRDLEAHGWPVPTPEDVYAYARILFPEDRLHGGPDAPVVHTDQR